MILADTIAIFLSVIGVLLATNALWLFDQAVWAKQTEIAGDLFLDSPWKSFFLGLPVLVATVLIAGILSKIGKGPSELVTLVTVSLFFLLASIGVSGFASKVGEKLEFDNTKSWKRCCFGGAVLELAFLIPILGWVVLFPVVTITGCGAAVRGIFRIRKMAKITSASASNESSESALGKKNSSLSNSNSQTSK